METEINGKNIQVLYAVCFDPDDRFNPFDFIINEEFDFMREAHERYMKLGGCREGYRIYVEAAIMDAEGYVELAYWGKTKQAALKLLKEKEKL
jgi:hypothetical protein